MHAQIKHWQHTLVTITMGVCLALLGACGWTSPPTPTFLPTLSPSPRDLPEFLHDFYPDPDNLVLQGDISTTNAIWAVLELDKIAEPGEILSPEEMQSRVEFSIDGELQDIRIIQYRNRPTQAAIVGRFALSLGEHEATVRVRKASGEVLEHSGRFTVRAEDPTVPGLPEGLQFVRPLPDSTITVQAYREERLLPAYYYQYGFANLRGGVCVGVLTSEVVETGDILDCGGVFRKFPFVALDGVPPDEGVTIEGGCELEKIMVTDEDGQVISSYPGPHAYKCWKVELAPGEHKVTVELRKTSGEAIEYTWRFTITPD